MTSLRHRLGVWLYDLRPFRHAVGSADRSWLTLRNRHERIRVRPDGGGVLCEWEGSSELHAARVMPSLGLALMRRALSEHPIRSTHRPVAGAAGGPLVSFVIGHRGVERLPLLQAVLTNIASQTAPIECVVVEEAMPEDALSSLPAWVQHVRVPLCSPEERYRRGRNFNVGARAARGDILIFHDGDILVPDDYSAEARRRMDSGAAIVDLKRYLFYLTQAHSERVADGRASLAAFAPESVVQNAPGGTIAVRRNAFNDIGGFDEEFVGWGGEDVEFLERAATRELDRFGSLPFVHLWHPPQPAKTPEKETAGMARYRKLSAVPPAERIAALRGRARG